MLIHSTSIYPVRHRPKHQVFYFAKVFSGQDLWINEIFSEYGIPSEPKSSLYRSPDTARRAVLQTLHSLKAKTVPSSQTHKALYNI